MSRVDRSWAKFNDMMSNTRVQKAIQSGKTTPEDVTKLVFSQSPAERAQLYRLLDDSGRQMLEQHLFSVQWIRRQAIQESLALRSLLMK